MNFDFSDEQKMLRDEARCFLERHCPPELLRAVLAAAGGYEGQERMDELWRSLAAQGWLGAAIPEAHGGLGRNYLELCCIAEELGRALAPVPFGSTIYLFAETVLAAGDPAMEAEFLEPLARGAMIGTLALAERPGALRFDAVETRLRNGRISGCKLPVTDGGIADIAVVLAVENGEPRLFAVDLAAPGVTREPLETIDPTRGAARILFENVPARPLGQPGRAEAILARVYDRAATLLAFEQIGGADRALELARDYALERQTFGRPIGMFQSIKHMLADVYAGNVLARSHAYHAAWALHADAPELPVAAACAQIATSDAYWQAARQNVQVHGGMGYVWDSAPAMHFRRARFSRALLGSPASWKQRLIARLGDRKSPVRLAESADGL